MPRSQRGIISRRRVVLYPRIGGGREPIFGRLPLENFHEGIALRASYSRCLNAGSSYAYELSLSLSRCRSLDRNSFSR